VLARRLSVALIAVLAFAAPGAHAQSAQPRSITVVGDATMTAPNDTADLAFRVESRARRPGAALAATSARTRRVVAAITAQGVAAADIQTQELSLRRLRAVRGRRTRGFIAVNSIRVTVRDLSKTSAVIDGAIRAGANGFVGAEFSSSKADQVYQQALNQAYTNARAKAQALAAQAGVTLGDPLQIVEGPVEPGGEPTGERAPAAVAIPIEPGTTTIEAIVTVTFAIS
jgi:uncharacterized protein YggE